MVYLYVNQKPIPFLSRKTTGAYYSAGVVVTNDPFSFSVDDVNLLDREKSGISAKRLIADPFLISRDSVWYLFFEIMGRTGADIGVAKLTTDNELDYLGIVLDEPKHLSYPQVIEDGETMYMIPESKALNGVRLYESTSFPMGWKYIKDLIPNVQLADPTLLKRDDSWYLFGETDKNLELYTADSLLGTWQKHPMSPVKKGNYTRPAGRIFATNNKLIRFGQDSYGGYGRQVFGFNIDSITTAYYKETPLKKNPVVEPQGDGWAKNGMHHLDIQRTAAGTFLIALDGKGFGDEKIIFSFD